MAGPRARESASRRRVAAVLCAAAALAATSLALADQAGAAKLRGDAVSGSQRLGSKRVQLYRAGSAASKPVRLARGRTRGNGSFEIGYRAPRHSKAPLYLIVGRPDAVRLAAMLGTRPFPARIVVNDRTTVAAGFGLAQFISGGDIAGSSPGLPNAAAMAANLANVRTGRIGKVLRQPPNGEATSTIETFNSLANMLPRCARSARRCSSLLRTARVAGEPRPKGTLDAIALIARNPWNHVKRLFQLAGSVPTPYRPALPQDERPDGWTLGLRFDGDGISLDGPGAFAIDGKGNLWVNNNYNYGADPRVPQCASDEVFKFKPDGRFAKGSPFTGGGLSGAGFGIGLDPDGHVWVGNYGFQGIGCTDPPPRNSVSEFTAKGEPLSAPRTSTFGGGYVAGPIDEPQATLSDRDGNIWLANCGGDTVTIYPDGDPSRAFQSDPLGIESPFGVAINSRGQAFVSGNQNSRVAIVNPDGTPAANSPISDTIRRPMGLATDSRGNVWVANSGQVLFPCAPPEPPYLGDGSVSLLDADTGEPTSGSPYVGGGTLMPWGIAVDGNDNVWVANFQDQAVGNLCGTRPKHCPKGVGTGDPIAPDTGYGFDGLTRNTGVAVDPSGNVWLTNNWLLRPIQSNPGGHEIVAYVGAAAPLKTPFFGPPVRK